MGFFSRLFGAPNEDLLSAAKNSDVIGVKRALEAGADVNVKDKFGSTPLMYGIRFSRCEYYHPATGRWR